MEEEIFKVIIRIHKFVKHYLYDTKKEIIINLYEKGHCTIPLFML